MMPSLDIKLHEYFNAETDRRLCLLTFLSVILSWAEVGPPPQFQVIDRNTQMNRLDVWHPLRPSLPDKTPYCIFIIRERNSQPRRNLALATTTTSTGSSTESKIRNWQAIARAPSTTPSGGGTEKAQAEYLVELNRERMKKSIVKSLGRDPNVNRSGDNQGVNYRKEEVRWRCLFL